MTMFERIVIGLLVLMIAGLGAAFYTDWKLAVQIRTLKSFAESYVFSEAVAACEKTQSSTPFKWNGGTNKSVRAGRLHAGGPIPVLSRRLRSEFRQHLNQLASGHELSTWDMDHGPDIHSATGRLRSRL